MSVGPEQGLDMPAPPSTGAFILHLLDMVEQTTWLSVITQQYDEHPVSTSPHLMFREAVLQSAVAHIRKNQEDINAGLQAIGGIAHYIDINGQRTRCRYMQWLGTDAGQPPNHLWITNKIPGQPIAISPSYFDELRTELQFDA